MNRKYFIGVGVLMPMLMSSAYAQSNVILYGVIDTGIEYVNKQPTNGSSVVRMTTGNYAGSRWGLRGVEDLGGGLKGLFVLESGFESDTGLSSQGGRLFGRAAYVGLQSGWGEVRLGRQNSALFDLAGDVDPTYVASHYSVLNQDANFAARLDNTVKYIGVFGPLKATALYSFGVDSTKPNSGEIPGNYKIGREFGGNVAYTFGKATVTAVYEEVNSGTPTVNSDATTRRAVLAGNYSFGNVALYAGYRWAKAYHGAVMAGAPSGLTSPRSNLWWTGFRWSPSGGAMTFIGGAYFQDFADTKADPWLFTLAADYEFSKRTDAVLSLGYTKNRSGSNLGLGTGGSGFGTVLPGANQFGATFFVRHKF